MVGRRDTEHRGQGDVRHGSHFEDMHKNPNEHVATCMGPNPTQKGCSWVWACGGCTPRSSHTPPGRCAARDGQKVARLSVGDITIHPNTHPKPDSTTRARLFTTHHMLCVHGVYRRSGFKKFVRNRAKARPKPRRWAHFDDSSGGASQCPRCDKGLHRRCLRLKHCTAKERSPPGINKRRQGNLRSPNP